MNTVFDTTQNDDGTLGMGRALAPILEHFQIIGHTASGRNIIRQDVTLPMLRQIIARLGLPIRARTREPLVDAIAESHDGKLIAAAIGALISVAVQIQRPATGLTAHELAAFDYARAQNWAALISDFTLAELTTLYTKIEPKAYGDMITYNEVQVKPPRSARTHTAFFPSLAIRIKGAQPTHEEIISAIEFADRDNEYRVSHLRNPNTKFRVKELRRLRITPALDWETRAHFGAFISYMTTTESFVKPNMASEVEGLCAYQVIEQDLNLDQDAVKAIIGKEPEVGLTPEDMIKVYQHEGRTLYCFDLMQMPKLSTVVPNDERKRIGREQAPPFLLMFGNNHVYRPNAETRETLLKSTADKKIYKEEVKEEHKHRPAPHIIQLATFDEAMVQAAQIANTYGLGCMHRKVADYELATAQIEARQAELKPFNGRKAVREELKTLRDQKAALATEFGIVKAQTRKAPTTYIYVPQAEISAEYKALILRGLVYTSDIDRSLVVTQMTYAPKIHIYANPDYPALAQTAQELSIPYKNQTIPALVRASFKRFKSGKWESSILNNAVSEILAQHPPMALNYATGTTLDKGHEIAAVDFYRHYTSILYAGCFYTCPMLSDIEPYDRRTLAAETHIYFVKTRDALLFAGDGVYDFKVVAYGLGQGLIRHSDIKLQIAVARAPIVDQTLHSFIDMVYSKVTEDRHRKGLVNSLIGSFAASHKWQGKRCMIVEGMEETAYCYYAMDKADKRVVPIGEANGNEIFLVDGYHMGLKRKSDELIRRGAMQRARMMVYDLMMKVGRMYPVIRINTDAVYYKKPKPTPKYPTDNNGAFGSTRDEPVDAEKAEETARMTIEPLAFESTYSHKPRTWTEPLGMLSNMEYFDATRLLEFKRAYVNGFAGSGKSHILRELRKLYEAKGLRVRVCALTHAAARQIGGETAHHVFGIDQFGRPCERAIKGLMNNTDILLIDELSMIPGVLYSILSQLPTTLTIIGFGDFRQHRPIEDNTPDRMYRDSDMFKALFGYTLIELRKQCRADAADANACIAFYDHLAEYGMRGAIEAAPARITRPIAGQAFPTLNICYTNRKRIQVNKAVV